MNIKELVENSEAAGLVKQLVRVKSGQQRFVRIKSAGGAIYVVRAVPLKRVGDQFVELPVVESSTAE